MMTSEEKKLMDRLKEKVREQEAELIFLKTAPKKFGTVVRVDGNSITWLDDHGLSYETQTPPGFSKIRAGSVVKVNAETGAIVDVERQSLEVGRMGTVVKLIDDLHAEVETEQGRKVVLVSFQVDDLKPGHRALLDQSASIITKSYGPEKVNRVQLTQSVSWDQIGGLEEAKQLLREAIELPISNPEIYKKYGRKPLKGIMLHGPPGCGKTLLGKAAYTSLASLYGAQLLSSGFIYVKGPEILSKWVGESEARVRAMFYQARDHFAENGFPAIIFLDEADAILGKRGARNSAIDHTLVPQFLAEMDGMTGSGQPLVIIATNRPETLDPAVVRDGRVDRKIRVERPGRPEVEEIFRINLSGKPTAEKDLAIHAADELMHDSKIVLRVIDQRGVDHNMTLAHAVNGAMVAGIVDRATELAMRRELSGGDGSGITRTDITLGIEDNLRQMSDIDLSDEVADFADLKRLKIDSISRQFS